MKKYKVLLLVTLPVFITLIYLSFKEGKVSNVRQAYINLNSSRVSSVRDSNRENKKLILKSELIVGCEIKVLTRGNYAKDTSLYSFYGVSIRNCNRGVRSTTYNEEIIFSNVISTKKRNPHWFSRIVVCKVSSCNLKYKVQFSF